MREKDGDYLIDNNIEKPLNAERVAKKTGAVSLLGFAVTSGILSLTLSLIYSSLSIFLCDLLGTWIVWMLSRKVSRQTVRIMTIGKIGMVILMLLVYYANITKYGAPYYRGGSDDLIFEETARYFVIHDMYWPWDYLYVSNQNGFYWLLSLFMRAFDGVGGYHTLSYRILNLDMLLGLAALTSTIFMNMGNYTEKQGIIVFCAVAFFPNAVNISVYVFRDTLYTLITMVCFTLMDDIFHSKESKQRLLTKHSITAIILLCTLAFWGYWIRSETLYLLIVFFFISMMKNSTLKPNRFIKYVLALVVLAIVLNTFGIIDYIVQKAQRYAGYRVSVLTSESNAIYQAIFNLPLFPFGWLARTVFGLISPLPTAAFTFNIFSDGLTFINVLVAYGVIAQIFMIPYLIMNINQIDKYLISYIVMAESVFLVTFTFRHFIILYPMLAILCFRKFFHTSKNMRKQLMVGSLLALGCLATLYLVVA